VLKLGTAFLLFLLVFTASADEFTYLVHTQSNSGADLRGAAYTDSDRKEVDGYVVLEHDPRARFAGVWTRLGKIEAVDRYGNMYVFDVIKVLNASQAMNLYDNF